MTKETKIIAIIAIFLFTFSNGRLALAQEKEETQLWRKGNAYCINGKWEKAISTFETLLKKYPQTKYVEAYFWIGYSRLELKKYNQGIADLKEFAKKYPSNNYAPQALYKIGETYEIRFKDYEKAIIAYNDVIQSYPRSIASLPAYQNQAGIYQQQKDYKKAEVAYEESKKAAKSQGLAEQNVYVVKANEKIRFIRENSDYDYRPLSLYTDGMNLEREQRLDEAANIYKKILEIYPKANIADEAFYQRIMCLMKLKQYDKARAESIQFLKDYPSSPRAKEIRDKMEEAKKMSENIKFMPAYYG